MNTAAENNQNKAAMKRSRLKNFFYAILISAFFISRLVIENVSLRIITRNYLEFYAVYNLTFILLLVFIFILVFIPGKPWLLITFYTLYSLYLFAQISYFYYYDNPMDLFGVLTVAGDGLNAFIRGSVLIRFEMFVPFLDLPLLVLNVIYYRKIHWRLIVIEKKTVIAVCSVTLFVLIQGSVLLVNYNKEDKTVQKIISTNGSLLYSAVKSSFFPPVPEPMLFENVEQDGTVITRDEDGNIVDIKNNPDYGYKKWTGSSENPPSFLLIQVESLQSGLERIKHNGQLVMPYLNSLTRNSVYYPYCYSYHNVGGTSDAEVSIFDNIEPADGKRMTSKNFMHENSFIKLLAETGYQRLAFHNYIKSFFNREIGYERIGFSRFLDFTDMEMTGHMWGSEDRQMFEYILNHSDSWTEPFMFYVITLTSHPGFGHIVFYYDAEFLNDIEKERDRNALKSFNYVDLQLSVFIPQFRMEFPNSYIFIFGDHSLATVDFAGHLKRSAVSYEGNLLEFVPLFILTPDSGAEQHPYDLASFHDFGPTVLSLSRRPEGEDYIQYPAYGGSLFFDEYEKMSVPVNNKKYDRKLLLNLIKDKIEPCFTESTAYQN